MAGAMCPNCSNRTLFQDFQGKTCTKCGFTVKIPVAKGKGKKCVMCGKFQVGETGVCRSCGAIHTFPND